MIDTDAQNLDIQSREPGFGSLVRRDLVRSYRSPGQRKESQDDRFPSQIAQASFPTQMVWEAEIGCFFTHF
jgi:hypothetical protein